MWSRKTTKIEKNKENVFPRERDGLRISSKSLRFQKTIKDIIKSAFQNIHGLLGTS